MIKIINFLKEKLIDYGNIWKYYNVINKRLNRLYKIKEGL